MTWGLIQRGVRFITRMGKILSKRLQMGVASAVRSWTPYAQSRIGPELIIKAENLNALHLSNMEDGFSVMFVLEPASS
jgi:hypothetical protein